jgi:hypothetical protein
MPFLINTLQYDDLKKKIGITGVAQTKFDVVYNYFGNAGFVGTMHDRESAFLTDAGVGVTIGTLSDRWMVYTENLGITGTQRISDRLRAWANS